MDCKVISIVDIKGGSKQDTFSLNLAKTFLDLGRVLLLDLDPQAKISSYLKIYQQFSIFNILNRSEDFHNVVQKTEYKNLFFLPSNIDVSKIEKDEVLISRISEVMKYLRTKFDYIIIETPPYLNRSILNVLNSSENIIIPFEIKHHTQYFVENLFLEIEKDKKVKIVPIMYEDENSNIYSDILKQYPEHLIKLGSTSLKIDKDDLDLDSKFKQIQKVILND